MKILDVVVINRISIRRKLYLVESNPDVGQLQKHNHLQIENMGWHTTIRSEPCSSSLDTKTLNIDAEFTEP